jgi:hypothetical protein
MIIGIHSFIGFTVIPGERVAAASILENALKTFQGVGALPAGAMPRDAVQFARGFADQLKRMQALPDRIVRGFPHIHSQICAQAAIVPLELHAAFDSFQREPTVAGAATYFGLLANVLSEEAPRQKPKTPSK